MDKAAFRKEMLLCTEALGAEKRKEQDKMIFSSFLSLEEVKNATKIFAYVSVGSEIATDKIIDELLRWGKEVYVPLCHSAGEMDAVRIKDRTELCSGRYNIPEPPSMNEKILPESIDLIIVPGVAFDREGMRLGRGGGYYDRFLKTAEKAVKVALCRDVNLEEKIPREPHDEPVDIIVSESEILKIR